MPGVPWLLTYMLLTHRNATIFIFIFLLLDTGMGFSTETGPHGAPSFIRTTHTFSHRISKTTP